jgi:hypothetical protein
LSDLQSITDRKEEGPSKKEGYNNNNISKLNLLIHVYALKSSKAIRQYPNMLKMLFGFLGLPGTIREQVQ